jgi:transcriptional/translational regulatory protein YebC/TACO1
MAAKKVGYGKWAHIQRRKRAQDMQHKRAAVRAGGACRSVRYEGYGPGDAAVMVDCLTDSPEQVAAEVRDVFERHGGHLGADGAVSYLFNPVGLILYPSGTNVHGLESKAFEAGAEDVVANEDGTVEVLTDPVEIETVRESLESAGLVPAEAEVTERAWVSAEVNGDAARCMVRLLDALEDLDGVQNVYSNAEIPDEVLASV